jgi:hypothetical protein
MGAGPNSRLASQPMALSKFCEKFFRMVLSIYCYDGFLHWRPEVKLWKVAISLAVVGAVAASVVLGTWKVRPTKLVWVTLTQQRRQEIESDRKRQVNSCKEKNIIQPRDFPQRDCENLPSCLEEYSRLLADIPCLHSINSLAEGREQVYREDQFKYWAINLAVPLAVFVGIFGLVMVFPATLAVVRAICLWYWKWLKT